MKERPLRLSDNEGTLLALVLRVQPVTAYQIAKIYEQSPVSNFNTSKGKVYPLIRRLREHGLIDAVRVASDARGTECLLCTEAGRAAVREWVKEVRPTHFLLEDPLRTKVQSFDLLSVDEQMEWVSRMKSGLVQKKAEVEAYGEDVDVPYKDLVHDNAIASLHARIDWLDRVSSRIKRRQPRTR